MLLAVVIEPVLGGSLLQAAEDSQADYALTAMISTFTNLNTATVSKLRRAASTSFPAEENLFRLPRCVISIYLGSAF